ncbi:MAG: hypothetical protein OEW16_01755 [Gammaproteobacteria bacterium]|nr:hypothetical protein [Gammaproteobacteria bacterium]
MTIKLGLLATSRSVVLVFAALISTCALAQSQASNVASAGTSLVGDHVRVQTHVIGFKESGRTSLSEKEWCAPRDSGVAIRHEADGIYTVRFYDIPNIAEAELKKTGLGQDCLAAGLVNLDSSYTISKNKLATFDYKRSGVTFGGLVIPFKFRLGGDKALSSSSTIAPYVGFSSRYLQFFGVSLNPVITGGVGFVPVFNPASGTAETRSAMSFGVGFVMTSSKNDQFSAGLILGRDVLSKSDRALDPNVNKPWLSFYLGVAM